MKKKHKKGFTLIEMLVVIAIIAILVAIIIPTVTSASTRAKAATDAANLRSILGIANVLLLENSKDVAGTIAGMTPFDCKTFPGAYAYIFYQEPGFIIAYFGTGTSIYTAESFAKAAETGKAPVPGRLPDDGEFYRVGGGKS